MRLVSCLLGAAALLGVPLVSAPAVASQTLTFDNITTNSCCDPVPNGYGSLNWDNFAVISKSDNPNSGYANAAVSGSYSAFNLFGRAATILQSATPFDLLSGYFTGAWNDGLAITVTGYSGTTPIDLATFLVDTSGPTFETFNWTGLTSVQFTSAGGIPNSNFSGSGTQFAMDNLVVNTNGAVPEPATWAMMLLGFGASGWAMRRARRKQTAYQLA